MSHATLSLSRDEVVNHSDEWVELGKALREIGFEPSIELASSPHDRRPSSAAGEIVVGYQAIELLSYGGPAAIYSIKLAVDHLGANMLEEISACICRTLGRNRSQAMVVTVYAHDGSTLTTVKVDPDLRDTDG